MYKLFYTLLFHCFTNPTLPELWRLRVRADCVHMVASLYPSLHKPDIAVQVLKFYKQDLFTTRADPK
mgnify:CR=1 FL=1